MTLLSESILDAFKRHSIMGSCIYTEQDNTTYDLIYIVFYFILHDVTLNCIVVHLNL